MDRLMQSRERIAASVVVFIALCWWVYAAYVIGTFPPEIRVQFIPDDAYYYLALARNFVNLGRWSFDSGVSLTSGFHLLHAYVLAAGYFLVRPSTEGFVRLGLLLSFWTTLPAVLLAMLFAVRSGRLLSAMLLLLLVSSRNIMLNTVSVVEWSWVVSLSALYVLAFRHLWPTCQKRNLVVLALIGCLGSLARTDFGILPAALALVTLAVPGRPEDQPRVWAALVGLAGAVLGVLLSLGHNYVFTGQYLQSRARIKSLWLATYGPSPVPIVRKTLTLFGTASRTTEGLAALLLLITVLYGTHRFVRPWFWAYSHDEAAADAKSAHDVLWLGSGVTVVAYMVFYSLNPAGMQNWYTAGLIAPVFLLLVLPFLDVGPAHVAHMAAVVLVLALMARQIPFTPAQLHSPEWPHQAFMLRAGRYLHQHDLSGRVASWNAGIIGYYEGGHVMNLDGLVNNDIYEYARQNRLPEYIDEKGIDYILDFENMFSSKRLRTRGGYDSSTFLNRLKPVKRFDNSSRGWHALTLYKIFRVKADRPERIPPVRADKARR